MKFFEELGNCWRNFLRTKNYICVCSCNLQLYQMEEKMATARAEGLWLVVDVSLTPEYALQTLHKHAARATSAISSHAAGDSSTSSIVHSLNSQSRRQSMTSTQSAATTATPAAAGGAAVGGGGGERVPQTIHSDLRMCERQLGHVLTELLANPSVTTHTHTHQIDYITLSHYHQIPSTLAVHHGF